MQLVKIRIQNKSKLSYRKLEYFATNKLSSITWKKKL